MTALAIISTIVAVLSLLVSRLPSTPDSNFYGDGPDDSEGLI